MYIHPLDTDGGAGNMINIGNIAAEPPRVVTVRDYLTDKHGFTLPASRLCSYSETMQHTSSSLFRHPKVFSIHYHASVYENDCDTPLEEDKWERGEYFKEGHTTVWAHFIRNPGVDIFGKSLEKKEGERARNPATISRKYHLLRLSNTPGDRVEKRSRTDGNRTKKKFKLLEGYCMPPPNSSPHPYYSQWTEIVPLPQTEGEEEAECVALAPPFRGFQYPMAAKTQILPQRAVPEGRSQTAHVKKYLVTTNTHRLSNRAAPENHGQKARVEISLLSPEPEVRIKPELPLGWSDDEGGLEWDSDDY